MIKNGFKRPGSGNPINSDIKPPIDGGVSALNGGLPSVSSSPASLGGGLMNLKTSVGNAPTPGLLGPPTPAPGPNFLGPPETPGSGGQASGDLNGGNMNTHGINFTPGLTTTSNPIGLRRLGLPLSASGPNVPNQL